MLCEKGILNESESADVLKKKLKRVIVHGSMNQLLVLMWGSSEAVKLLNEDGFYGESKEGLRFLLVVRGNEYQQETFLRMVPRAIELVQREN